MSHYPTFRDGKRTIDFILVFKSSLILTETVEQKHRAFLDGLEKLGLEQETEHFSADYDVVFIKLHAPNSLILSFAGLFDIDLACQSFEYRPYIAPPLDFMATPLTNPNPNDPIYSRAPESISGEIPKKITSAERIMVIYQILNRCVWGPGRGDYGIAKLQDDKVFIDHYPLHDGDYELTTDGPLNDRQLLALYWGSPHCWKKAQPLNLIEKYFGTEYAVYFAWLGMYIKLLIPAAFMSILVIIYATVFMELWQREESVLGMQWNLQSLEYTISLRPEFIERATKSRYSSITGKMEPYVPKMENVYRYTITLLSIVFLLIIMCLATFGVMVYRVTVIVLLAEKGKSDLITEEFHRHMIASGTGSLMSAFFILIFKSLYEAIALYLNNLENHRTWSDYSNSFIFKSYALAFTNNYAAVFYIAFFKGKFFTYPGDNHIYSYLGGINTDVCDPTGCIIDLAILLIIIMGVKAVMNNVLQVYLPKLKTKVKRTRLKVKTDIPQWEEEYLLDKAEEFFIVNEYMDMVIQYGFVNFFIMGFPLAPCLALLNNISELRVDASKVIKSYRRPVPIKVVGLDERTQVYGAFLKKPWINTRYKVFQDTQGVTHINIIRHFHNTLYMWLLTFQFPSVVFSGGFVRLWKYGRIYILGAWFGILQAMTYIGVVTNALVIAFTSNYMEKLIFRSLYGSDHSGFLNQTLSIFNMSEFQYHDSNASLSHVTLCYYPGKRYPPDHELKYQRRKDYWHHLGIKFGAVVIFEHIVIIIKGLLAYAIPDVPFSVKQQLVYQEKMNRMKRTKEINQTFIKKREKMRRSFEEKLRKDS